MVQNRNLAYDLNRFEVAPKKIKEPEFKVIKSKKQAVKPRSKVSLVVTAISIFAMLIVISYRYNLISEKNLEVQRQNMLLEDATSILATTEINAEQNSNLDYIESYAKQQLGMQKPEKSQIVYINANYDSEIKNLEEQNIFSKLADSIKNIFN